MMSFSQKSKVETLINTLINKIYNLNSQQVLKLDNMEILIIDSLFNTKIIKYNCKSVIQVQKRINYKL